MWALYTALAYMTPRAIANAIARTAKPSSPPTALVSQGSLVGQLHGGDHDGERDEQERAPSGPAREVQGATMPSRTRSAQGAPRPACLGDERSEQKRDDDEQQDEQVAGARPQRPRAGVDRVDEC